MIRDFIFFSPWKKFVILNSLMHHVPKWLTSYQKLFLSVSKDSMLRGVDLTASLQSRLMQQPKEMWDQTGNLSLKIFGGLNLRYLIRTLPHFNNEVLMKRQGQISAISLFKQKFHFFVK